MSVERPLEGRRVLVVEDQYLVADEMRRVVESLGGIVVGPAARAQAAAALLQHQTVDLALLDINLGGENVYPLAMELNHRNILFVFATGCEPWVIPKDFAGVLRIEKPVTGKALTETLRRLGV
jgi:CheY-like chemotaxis protein